MGDYYSVTVTDGNCATTAIAIVVELKTPKITEQPQNQTGCIGSNIIFQVVVEDIVNNENVPIDPDLNFQWQFSTNNGITWENITGSYVFTNITSTNTTIDLLIDPVTSSDAGKYRCIISNSCEPATTSSSAILNVGCSDGYTISGYVNYDNSESNPMGCTSVNLNDENDNTLEEAQTGSDGSYTFNNISNGTYNLTCTSTIGWGGSNPTDALIVNRYYIGKQKITDPLWLKAADVNEDGKINPLDALIINRRYIGVILSFKLNDWLFENPTVIIDGNSVVQDIKAECAGDVNGSYKPFCRGKKIIPKSNFSNKWSMSVNKLSKYIVSIDSVYSKSGQTINLGLRFDKFDTVNAFGFKIRYDTTVLAFDTITGFDGLMTNRTHDSLNIAWASASDGIKLDTNLTKMFDIEFKYKGGHTYLTFLDGSMVGGDNEQEDSVNFISGYVGNIPQVLTKCTSDSATFSVSATSLIPLSYQWYKNDSLLITNATDSLLTIKNLSLSDSGTYNCLISNSCGSNKSDEVILKVHSLPEIVHTSSDTTLCAGASTSFSVNVTGTPPMSYKWLKNGNYITDDGIYSVSTNTLILDSVNPGTAGNYNCIVSNSCGSVTSDTMILNVNSPPSITSQPESVVSCQSSQVSFNVIVSGTSPISYIWSKNGVVIPNISTSTFNFSCQLADTGRYNCVISNSCGSVSSNYALLTVNSMPVITQQPTGISSCTGAIDTFSIIASGTNPISYQWYRNDTIISEAISTNFTVTATNSENYQCIVSNICGLMTSNNATLTVNRVPIITTQPTGDSVCIGLNKTFNILATAIPSATYQWFKNDTIINNANQSSFTLDSLKLSNAGNYKCIISNLCGTDTSFEVNLYIKQPPNIITQPIGNSACVGDSVLLTLSASGTNPIVYSWYCSSQLINSNNSSDFELNLTNSSQTNNYKCTVSNSCGFKTSDIITITVNRMASIISQPEIK